MIPHAWTVESVDGAMMGGDFWICQGCGASGGPVWKSSDRAPTWRPFLAGEGYQFKLSDDCEEASSAIRAQTLKRFEALPTERPDISRHYASLVRDALRCTPDKKNVASAYRLYWDVQHESTRLSLMQVRQKLVAEGYEVVPCALADAVVSLGEELRREQTGEGEP
jgi:hypothetical protein